jgi:hypothetical protein
LIIKNSNLIVIEEKIENYIIEFIERLINAESIKERLYDPNFEDFNSKIETLETTEAKNQYTKVIKVIKNKLTNEFFKTIEGNMTKAKNSLRHYTFTARKIYESVNKSKLSNYIKIDQGYMVSKNTLLTMALNCDKILGFMFDQEVLENLATLKRSKFDKDVKIIIDNLISDGVEL